MRRRRPKLFLKGRSARARRQLLAVFLLVFAPGLPRSARGDCVPFAAPPEISTEADSTVSVATGDIDGDGDDDVLSTSIIDQSFFWFENDGAAGGWAVHTISSATIGPEAIRAADLDGDGDLDVLASAQFGDTVLWHENRAPGDGSVWSLHVVSTSLDGADFLSAADLDGDGDLDALAASHYNSLVAWFRNDGTPGDGPWTLFTVTDFNVTPRAAVAADIDGDGGADIVSASYWDDTIAWQRSYGPHTWSQQVISTSADGAFGVATGDLDGDGDLDVLSASYFDDTIAWYENIRPGDGSPWGTWSRREISTGEGGAHAVLAADLDRDGDLDALSASGADDTIAWYENDGSGTSWTRHVLATAADSAQDVAVADLDRDGDLDVLSASKLDDTVAWYRNDRLHGAPLFRFPAVTSGIFDEPRQLAAADFDGHGAPEIVSASQLNDRIGWTRYNGPGPGSFNHVLISSAMQGPLSVATGDVDGDGDLDLFSASRDDDTIAWHENVGAPGTGFTWTLHTISIVANVARQVVAADLDRDGDLDAVSASRNDDKVAWYENVDLTSPGTGDGSAWSLHTVTTAANGAFSVAVADLDGDGDLDLASASFYDDDVRWYESDGSPASGWSLHQVSTVSVDPRFVVAGDVDRDGAQDLVAVSSGDESIVFYENDLANDGTWLAHTVTSTATDVYSALLVDVDGDGDLDIASANFGNDTVAWYENDGSGGGWTPHVVSTAADGPTSVVLADWDRDGDLDAFFVSTVDDSFRVATNLGTLVFAEGEETNEGTACWSSAVP